MLASRWQSNARGSKPSQPLSGLSRSPSDEVFHVETQPTPCGTLLQGGPPWR